MDSSPAPEGKANAWTEEAKYQFLLRIIAQLRGDGRSINWSRISMPGRTTKSLTHMWTKINKSIQDLESQEGDEPSPKATPRKRGPNKKSEDGNEPQQVTPQKRGAAKTGSSTKKAKTETEDEIVVFKKKLGTMEDESEI